ncbi:MAG: carboxylate--amine ligase [Chromatiales bacterium 21-64-14]|nr:MAG: carboxylate--amine ligase [Chromatiales bacterium 21-64-14]HQU15904.1 RimK family protein [Gammaproteobacteria bacterium]
MTTDIIVLENSKDWQAQYPDAVVITDTDYIGRQQFPGSGRVRIINLCRSYRYLSTGYYCSLLAEARRHKVIPTVKTISDLSRKSIYNLEIGDLDDLVQKSLRNRPPEHGTEFEFHVFFGQCESDELQDLAREIFELFPCPLLKVEFKRQGKWEIDTIRPAYIHNLRDDQQALFTNALNRYVARRWQGPRTRQTSKYDLAILHNPQEQFCPSNKRALQSFIKEGKGLGVDVELIEKKDYTRLAEFDALFIRETTAIDHYTYRFSKKAESEGMVVVDDPDSILKCTNKVYLAELLKANRIPTPKTIILQRDKKDTLQTVEAEIPYPVILKIPDGSFSRGVFKATNRKELEEITTRLFKESDLLLAQEFRYTPFDWRIGIFNRRPVYACQYFMSRKHWQIVKHRENGRPVPGDANTLSVDGTPSSVVETALRAANLIGDGLYGVDLKEDDKGVCVIEVNDNPNIDAGVEDGVLKDRLYRTLLEEFVRRMDLRRS